ncbi:MAG: carboxylating nicotinate-nucleotide diphosphorylase [Tenuifilaceae bacterium]|jgi:nicotinate-nucleotide pyrophosphorylase (carboxylating)|nr:carboxylating nicotinate-nucleotide diphosphorylase [Bacteroidales bacterium]MDI9516892.1 carboxylating nicotinate-nucleotide diphosphorylase [Bacteroidota bacterium]NLH56393.1 carboxylating nicotinate-nucleotide diphosphorylase [Rikenellaceae bacterium]OQC63177.1 MAG: putative nicotinate-nucleotide pyrophosphorylase (carboxylating) [Bacteroidetes bacterium ADurb.Bin008]HNV81203.1 carboxylating nicotinate-nucleotide diphosphorylase [Tenuifilaceae bacterium]
MPFIDSLINLAIAEDIGDGDHSSLSCIPADAVGTVQLKIKQQGVLAGIQIARQVYQRIDPEVNFESHMDDGVLVNVGDIPFTATGRVHSLLQAERIVLNIMQRMSGIATQTREYVDRIKGTNAKVLDTRKTTPGMRILDKLAVRIGGGFNHRMGLFDMIMLKDNHIDFAGGIVQAIGMANDYLKKTGKALAIEIETRNLDEVRLVLATGGVNRIMLDNFSVEQTHEAVKLINGRFETESSGGITLETIRNYAEAGVDYISVGALTHQIKSLDMNLKKI